MGEIRAFCKKKSKNPRVLVKFIVFKIETIHMINNIWILIGKKLNNEASLAELEDLERLLKEDINGNYPLELIESLWNESDESNDPVSEEWLEEKWQEFSQMINNEQEDECDNEGKDKLKVHERFRLKKYLWGLVACLIVLLVSVVAVKMMDYKTSPAKDIEIATAKGSIRKISLPDGSSVILNAGSRISYKKTFDAKHRALFLSGEALFDIAKDPKHPFVVNTQSMKIRVLGTKFNVKAYPDDNVAEASLFRGSIELSVVNEPDRKILLKPSEKIKVFKESVIPIEKESKIVEPPTIKLIELGQVTKKLQDSIPEEMMWMNHQIVFDSELFGQIAKEMERKYNVSIIFKNEDAEKYKFTGRFDDIPIEQALNKLELIAKFNYKINGDVITIY